MGLKLYGIAAVQSPDRVGETIDINNIDISTLRYLNDEHSEDMFSMLGGITAHKKILKAADAESSREKKCWNEVQKPFLYIEGELANDHDHPNAKAAASMLKFCAQNPGLPLQIGLSVEGGILERSKEDRNFLSETKAEGVSLTVKPCHPDVKVYLMNDLMKSAPEEKMPEKYEHALKTSSYTPSFKDVSQKVIIERIQKLQKSMKEFKEGITSIKCHHCGNSVRFFKGGNDWPNYCNKCEKPHKMIEIYKALTKET